MKELVEFIVKSIVDNPDEVRVVEIDGPTEIYIELSVEQGDIGRVIGKRGRVINSIRALVQVLAAKKGRNVSLELIEEDA
jgi:predicted RNA-binding protein YlqC (UPF0109 family)